MNNYYLWDRTGEPDAEIQNLIGASAGLNIALDYLPGSVTFDPLLFVPDAELASAIVGASRPEQVHANAAASGLKLTPDVLQAIDEALDDVPVKGQTLAVNAPEGVRHRA